MKFTDHDSGETIEFTIDDDRLLVIESVDYVSNENVIVVLSSEDTTEAVKWLNNVLAEE